MMILTQARYLESQLIALSMPKLNLTKIKSQLFDHFVSSGLGGGRSNITIFHLLFIILHRKFLDMKMKLVNERISKSQIRILSDSIRSDTVWFG